MPQQASRFALGAFDLALFAIVVAVWGSSWLPLKLQLGVVAPEVSGVWRFAAASVVMFCWLLIGGHRIRFGFADHVRFAILGALLFCLNFALAMYGAFYLTSGLLAVIFSLAAVISPLLAASAGRAPLEGRVIAGAVLGAAGVSLLFGPEIVAADASRETLIGLAYVFAATIFFCIGSVVSATYQQRGMPVLSSNTWCTFYGALWFAVIVLLRGETFTVEWTARYIGSVAFLAIASTVIGFAAYVTLLGRVGAGRASYSTVLVPVVALAISTVVEGYHWTSAAVLGVVLVLVGNVIVLSKGQAQT